MARMEVDGADALIEDLSQLAQMPCEVTDDILNAMADVIVPAQRKEIERRWSGPHSMGISAKAIKKTGTKKELDGSSISVFPQGTRKRGKKRIRNGEIAFINEYGAPGRGIEVRPAIMAATAKNEQKAVKAGERVYHAYLDSKNL